jgi:hypothetical protein
MNWRLISIAVMVVAMGLIWWAWTELNLLRRTVFWEYRLVIFLAGAIALLSIFDTVFTKIKTRINPPEEH